MTTTRSRPHALVVRGGWDGHHPVEATELFIPFLVARGYDVRIEESPEVYADAATMAEADLVLQTMAEHGLRRVVFTENREAEDQANVVGAATFAIRATGADFVRHITTPGSGSCCARSPTSCTE